MNFREKEEIWISRELIFADFIGDIFLTPPPPPPSVSKFLRQLQS